MINSVRTCSIKNTMFSLIFRKNHNLIFCKSHSFSSCHHFYCMQTNQVHILNIKNCMTNLSDFPRMRGFHLTFHVQFSSLNFNEDFPSGAVLSVKPRPNIWSTFGFEHFKHFKYFSPQETSQKRKSFISITINKYRQHWNKFFPLLIFYLLFYKIWFSISFKFDKANWDQILSENFLISLRW